MTQLREHGVKAGQEKIGVEARGDPRKSSRDADERVAAEGKVDHGGERRKNDVTGIASQSGHDANEESGRGEELARESSEAETEEGGDEAGAFGDADPEHADKDDPKGRKFHEVLSDVFDRPKNAIGGEEAVGPVCRAGFLPYGGAFGGLGGAKFRDFPPAHNGGMAGDQHEDGANRKEGGRIGKAVADCFNESEKAAHKMARLSKKRGRWRGLSTVNWDFVLGLFKIGSLR